MNSLPEQFKIEGIKIEIALLDTLYKENVILKEEHDKRLFPLLQQIYWYAFGYANQKQYHHFDVVKIKKELSADLIKTESMLCKLLALKANDKGIDPEMLVREIYKAFVCMKEKLSDDQQLLVELWIRNYKKYQMDDNIKEKVNMSFVASTISEYFFHEGEIRGEIKGKIEGKIEGEIKGEIKALELPIRYSQHAYPEFCSCS